MGKRLLSSVALVVLAGFAVFGCGQREKSENPASAQDPKVASPDTQKGKTGTIVGKIVYKGTPPIFNKIKVNKDNGVCGNEQVSEELVVDHQNGGIKGAVVTIKGLVKGDLVSQDKVIDQKGCRFQPHVLVVAASDKVNILNSDGVLHNIHAFAQNNPSFNEAQPKFKKQITKQFNRAPDLIKIKCDVHGWMDGWIVVVRNPYYSVTDEDGGFRIENVPVGRQVLEVWHESLGIAVMEANVKEGEVAVVTLERSLNSEGDKTLKKKGTTVAKPIFDANCVACHGALGKGDGPAAASLPHKPANLTSKDTQVKSDTILKDTIKNGTTKGMPPWKQFSDKDIKNLVDYIRYLGGK